MNLKSLLPASVLVLPLILAACNGGSSKSLNDDVKVEPQSCEVSGSGFGIVGGMTLESGNALSSSTVLIITVDYKDQTSICTGTLIAKDKVLTAAHCTNQYGGKSAIAFSNNVKCVSDAPKRTLRLVEKQAVHPNYRYSGDAIENSSSDIAVLKFAGDLPAGYQVRNLPSSTYRINPADGLVMTGYGKTDEDASDSSGILRFTRAGGNRLSKSYYSAEKKMTVNLSGVHVLEQNYNGVCSGDSGGPLYTYANGQLTLIGIVSAGIDNNATRYTYKPRVCHGVSVFADVLSQLSWIERQRDSL